MRACGNFFYRGICCVIGFDCSFMLFVVRCCCMCAFFFIIFFSNPTHRSIYHALNIEIRSSRLSMRARGFEAKFRHCVMTMISFYVFLWCCVFCRRGDCFCIPEKQRGYTVLFMNHLARDKRVCVCMCMWNRMELKRNEKKIIFKHKVQSKDSV